jgi:hypothetical protein
MGVGRVGLTGLAAAPAPHAAGAVGRGACWVHGAAALIGSGEAFRSSDVDHAVGAVEDDRDDVGGAGQPADHVGWEGLAVERLAHAGLVEAGARLSRSMSTSSSAGRRAPGAGVAVTMLMNASAPSWSKLRPSSGSARSAAMAASNAEDNRASASGSRLMWVRHMPSPSRHRHIVPRDRSFSWWRKPSSREIRRASPRILRATLPPTSTPPGSRARAPSRPVRRALDRRAGSPPARSRRRDRRNGPAAIAAGTSGIASHSADRSMTTSASPDDRPPPADASARRRATTAASTESSQHRNRCKSPASVANPASSHVVGSGAVSPLESSSNDHDAAPRCLGAQRVTGVGFGPA